jgi:hypothetical protein
MGNRVEQQRNREDKFRDSWNLEYNKEDILAKKIADHVAVR